MAIFLLQRENGFLSEEVNTVRECINEYNWLHPDTQHSIVYSELKDVPAIASSALIPVGSIDFTESCFMIFHDIRSIKPMLIPPVLRNKEFLQRNVTDVFSKSAIKDVFNEWQNSEIFIKSASKCKTDITDLYKFNENDHIPNQEKYFLSEPLDILSEWRVFVWREKIIDTRCYCGDPWLIPSKEKTLEIVKCFTKAPSAYTLDLAVIKDDKTKTYKTTIIELHNFISCGFYGFHDAMRVPAMLSDAWKYEINQEALII